MISIREITEAGLKMEIVDKILHALPDWFGNENAIQNYIKISAELPFWGVFDKKEAVGFLAMKPHNSLHAELCVMGILTEYHHMSIGRGLFNTFQNYCINNNYKYISVKTLDSSINYEPFNKTRKFYKAMGFLPFEVNQTAWDAENPCLIMIKDLKDADNSYKCKIRSSING
ncbi:MAG: GNAT family N-acetyltransferase [Defluviitaleaceae bacterium]|nr:GNAT family N-acetyltransferase [Defluviitaleaceae bacterium]